MFDVFLKLAKIAHATIRDYAADFYYHDARVLRDMKPGDTALWAARESGSCLVIVTRGRVANERAMETFRAFDNSFPNLEWQLIDTDINGNWTVEPWETPAALIRDCSNETALLNSQRIQRGEKPEVVRELHM